VIEHGQTGLLTDFFDHEALARCTADALARRGELEAYRKNARELVRQRFDLAAKCLPRHLAIL
jgi:hypothetical protein